MRHGAGRAGAGCNLCFALFLPSLSWIFRGIARARKKARFARGDVVGLCAMTNSRETMRLLPSEGNTDDRIMRMLLGGRRGPKSGDTSNMKMNAIESQLFPLSLFCLCSHPHSSPSSLARQRSHGKLDNVALLVPRTLSLILISVQSPTVSRAAKGVRPIERDETLSEAIGQRGRRAGGQRSSSSEATCGCLAAAAARRRRRCKGGKTLTTFSCALASSSS